LPTLLSTKQKGLFVKSYCLWIRVYIYIEPLITLEQISSPAALCGVPVVAQSLVFCVVLYESLSVILLFLAIVLYVLH